MTSLNLTSPTVQKVVESELIRQNDFQRLLIRSRALNYLNLTERIETADIRISLKINESRYIALFVISGSVKKLFPIDYVNIYMFLIFFVSRFCPVEKCGIQK